MPRKQSQTLNQGMTKRFLIGRRRIDQDGSGPKVRRIDFFWRDLIFFESHVNSLRCLCPAMDCYLAQLYMSSVKLESDLIHNLIMKILICDLTQTRLPHASLGKTHDRVDESR